VYAPTAHNRTVTASGPGGPSALRSARSFHSHASLRAHLGGRSLLRKALMCPPKRRLQPERYVQYGPKIFVNIAINS
jgi:hypothetical protein